MPLGGCHFFALNKARRHNGGKTGIIARMHETDRDSVMSLAGFYAFFKFW